MNSPRTFQHNEFPIAVTPQEVTAAQVLLRNFADIDSHPEDFLAEHPILGLQAGRLITAACHPHLNEVVGLQNAILPNGEYVPEAHMRRTVANEHVAVRPLVDEQVVKITVYQQPYKQGRLKLSSKLPLIDCPRMQSTQMHVINHELPANRLVTPFDTRFSEHLQVVCGYIVDAIDSGQDATAAYIPPVSF